MNGRIGLLVVGFGCTLALGGPAGGADMTATATIFDPILLPGGSSVVCHATSRIYDFADRLADGSNQKVEPAGLNMSAYELRHLSGGTGGGDSRSLYMNLDGGDLRATTGSLRTEARNNAGAIEILSVGTIAMGDGYISSKRDVSGYNGTSGPIRIGSESDRAGAIQAAYIEVCAAAGGGNGAQGLYIHGGGDVLIQNSLGVAGNLVASDRVDVDSPGIKNGPIQVLHQGSFRAATVSLRNRSATPAFDIVFDGASVDPMTLSGTFSVSNVWTWTINSSSSHIDMDAAPVIVRNYQTVNIAGDIDTHTERTAAGNQNGNGGDVAITNIAKNLFIDGWVDARNTQRRGSYDGTLHLQADGRIILSVLMLNQVRWALLDAGSEAEVKGAITGTDGSPLAGSGGVLTNGANLRVPAGRVLLYHPQFNPGLGGGKFTLRNPDDTGPGGILQPWRAKGTVVCIR